MRARFPAVAATLGEPRFETCASAFLAGGGAAAGFAAFLSSALADLPARELVADLARFEHALAELRDQSGGDPPPLTALPIDGWEEARLTPIPALRLLDLDHAVVDYRAQLLAGGDPGIPAPRRCRLLVWRRGGRIRCAELTDEQHAVLSALAAGAPLAAALERGLESVADPRSMLAGAESWFRRWTGLGLFAAVAAPAQLSVQ